MSDEDEARTQSPEQDKARGQPQSPQSRNEPLLPKDARRSRKANNDRSEMKPLMPVTPNESIAKLPRQNQSASSRPKLVPQIFQRGRREIHSKPGAESSSHPTSSAWVETDDQIEYKHVDDPAYIKVVNCLMFCGLAQDSEILWNFAKFVIQRGGYFFIVIYWFMLFVLVSPVLHMEIFVGQWCQSGIVKTMRSYGKGFEFIGILITILLYFRATVGIHNSYPVAKHIVNLLRDPEIIVTCRSNDTTLTLERFCVSLVNDVKCKRQLGPGYFSYGTRCMNNTASITQVAQISKFYAEELRTVDYRTDYDTGRLVYLFGLCIIVAVAGALGFNVIRYFVAAVFTYYAIVFIIMIVPFFTVKKSITAIFHRLSTATTPESLFEPQTYYYAFYHAIKSAGLGLSAFLCASSFRSRKGNSFGLTYLTIFVNVIFGMLSLFYLLCVLNTMHYNIPIISKTSEDNELEGLDFISGTLTEVFMARGKSVFWLLSYNIAVFLISVSAFCACLISLCGFIRDHVKHHRHLWRACAALLYALAIFMYASIGGWLELAREWHDLTSDFYVLNIFVIIILMIVVFIHIYGSREYIIDLCEVYVLEEGQSPIRSATNSWQFVIFGIVPFLCLGNIYSELLTNVIVDGMGIIVVVCFGWRLYNNVKDDRGLASFFTITPEHISYRRISSGWKRSKKLREPVTT